MKKKFINTIFILSIVSLFFVGCSNNKKNNKNENNTTSQIEDTVKQDIINETTSQTENTNIVVTDNKEILNTTKDAQKNPVVTGDFVGISFFEGIRGEESESIKKKLETMGYQVELQNNANDAVSQASQIEDMINRGCKCIIINEVDVDQLNDVLQKAKNADIPVIAYEHLTKDSDAISYFVALAEFRTGTMQGEYIKNILNLDNATGPFNIEFMAGPAELNSNETYSYQEMYFDGAYVALKKYIDEGKLVIKSGKYEFEDISTDNLTIEDAQTKAEEIISNYYQDTDIDVWVCSDDVIALGVENALDKKYNGEYPIVIGSGCNKENINRIISKKQSMSLFKGSSLLVEKTVEIIDAIMNNKEVPITIDNQNKKSTPICDPKCVTIDNYKEILIDSGYYTEEDIKK